MFLNSRGVTFFFARTKKNLTEKRKCEVKPLELCTWLTPPVAGPSSGQTDISD
jgi:hypothetical protein